MGIRATMHSKNTVGKATHIITWLAAADVPSDLNGVRLIRKPVNRLDHFHVDRHGQGPTRLLCSSSAW
jgi:hypothetical protein